MLIDRIDDDSQAKPTEISHESHTRSANVHRRPPFMARALAGALLSALAVGCVRHTAPSEASSDRGESRAPASTGPRITADSSGFHLAGRPLQIISGEMHYARVPRAYWRDRFRMARAMGLNTISTYVFWNLHERTPGTFDFSGQYDVAEFVREAGEAGLHVILRPGPYVCAEWELGGYPAWLLADTAMVLRSNTARFTTPASRWLDRLGRELAPLLSSRGGPIVAVQVENEYGSFDKDSAYMAWQRDALLHAGFTDVLLYTADGDVQLPSGSLPGLPAVVNFGTGEADSAFARLARFRPNAPRMSGEYWAGWFDQWGQKHASSNARRQAQELEWMLAHGHSVNLYMFHGGTTPGFMNGANIDGTNYRPQTSGYDYDAALDESGRPTPKYFAFRDIIAKHTGRALPDVPTITPPIAIPELTLTEHAALFDNLPLPVRTDRPRTMEALGQSYGYVLYRTAIPAARAGVLRVRDVRDYAQVYVNRALVGTLDRRLKQDSLMLTIPAGATLDILVENSGRVNFRKELRTERKGITRDVTFGGVELTGWEMFSLPMASVPAPRFAAASRSSTADTRPSNGTSIAVSTVPAYWRGSFTLSRTGDTFLDTRSLGKGTVWVNGHHLGRYWGIGPQQTLYVPGVWLRAGRNEIVVFELIAAPGTVLRTVTAPVFANAN